MDQAQPIGTQSSNPPDPAPQGTSCLAWIIAAGLVLTLLGAILIPNFIKPSSQGALTNCKSNLKKMATELEMYANDNRGQYPAALSQIESPTYLKELPTCPAAGKVTYVYSRSEKPEAFTVFCQGAHHPTDSPNFPQYTAERGLMEHP
jgi:competence protein ComGC